MKIMKQFQILLILNAGLLFLAWGIGFSMGLRQTDVTVTLDSDQATTDRYQFRASTKSLHKLCTDLYLDSRYNPICFCKVETKNHGKKN